MKVFSNNFSKISLVVLVFVFTNCFKDDEGNLQQIHLEEQKVSGVMEDASKYPHNIKLFKPKNQW